MDQQRHAEIGRAGKGRLERSHDRGSCRRHGRTGSPPCSPAPRRIGAAHARRLRLRARQHRERLEAGRVRAILLRRGDRSSRRARSTPCRPGRLFRPGVVSDSTCTSTPVSSIRASRCSPRSAEPLAEHARIESEGSVVGAGRCSPTPVSPHRAGHALRLR